MSQVSRVGQRWELSLDNRQIFFVLFGAAAVASLLFLVGVIIGKRLEARAGTMGHCAPSLDDLDKISDKNLKFTFHEVLVRKGKNPNFPPEVYETADIDDPDSAGAGSASSSQAARNGQTAGKVADRARNQKNRKSALQRSPAGRGLAAAMARSGKRRRRFTLQVGSFRSRKEAESMVKNLKAKGLAPNIVTSYLKGRGMWYRVRVGAFESWKQSLRAKKDFERQWHMTAYVTRLR